LNESGILPENIKLKLWADYFNNYENYSTGPEEISEYNGF